MTFVGIAALMLNLSTTADVLAAVANAREISMLAYTLRPGRLEDALVDAARRGAHVRVRLEGTPYNDATGSLLANNQHAVDALRAAGADASLVHGPKSTQAPLHAKAVIADGALFLDDRNWADDGEETILRDTFDADRSAVSDAVEGRYDRPSPFFAIDKRDALASEARLLASVRTRDDVVVESESFGGSNRVYNTLEALAARGMHPRLLVAALDLQGNTQEAAALQKLERDGVQIRVTDADEKFALVNDRGWLGSTNASATYDDGNQFDWGARTDQPQIVAHLRDVFESRWKDATPLDAVPMQPASSNETTPAHCDP